MKKVLLALMTVFLLGMASAFAQSSNEPIVISKALIGHKYYHGDQLITRISDMKAIVANDELAFKQVKKAGITSGISNVLACAGGFAMGWEVGNLMFGKFNPYVFWGGVGVTAVGLGLSVWADSQLKDGVTIYNGNLGATSYGSDVEFDFGLVPGGIGLTLSF